VKGGEGQGVKEGQIHFSERVKNSLGEKDPFGTTKKKKKESGFSGGLC